MVAPPPPQLVIAWGQYLHWAHLHFEHFLALDEDVEPARLWGVVCHWLAAEYVVLEGWRELDTADARIERLLKLYPENCETLRRCRNAVYHFQRSILDQRLVDFITGKNEELQWACVLHAEFQRFLVGYPHMFNGDFDEKVGLADDIAACVGWFPSDIPLARQIRILGLCRQLQERIAAGTASDVPAAEKMIADTLTGIREVSPDYLASILSRWPKSAEGAHEA